jgi:hypothetical protein
VEAEALEQIVADPFGRRKKKSGFSQICGGCAGKTGDFCVKLPIRERWWRHLLEICPYRRNIQSTSDMTTEMTMQVTTGKWKLKPSLTT